MSHVEEVEVPWPIEVLTRIGYSTSEAEDLHHRLPHIEAGILAQDHWERPLRLYQGGDNPAAAVIWMTHCLPARHAARLASSGRHVLDLVTILDAVETAYPDSVWTQERIQVAASWIAALPIAKTALYIGAGFSVREAADLESDPDARPTVAALATLAALRGYQIRPRPAAREGHGTGMMTGR